MDNNQQNNNQQYNQQGNLDVQANANQQQYDAQQQYYQPYDAQQQYYQQYDAQQQYEMQQQYYQQQYEMQQQYYQQQYEQQNQAQGGSQDQAQQPNQQYYQQPENNEKSGSNGNNTSGGGNGKKNNKGLLIGIIAAVAVVIIAVVLIVVLKNKKSDDSGKKEDKTTTEKTTTDIADTTNEDLTFEDTTEDGSDVSTEEQPDNVNHDPDNGEDYVPENPILVDNEVMTIEIINIHHPNTEDEYGELEDTHYRWDLKVTSNRKKGGIWVNLNCVRYNGVEIGTKSLTPESRVAKGQTREVSIVWLDDHNWDFDYTGFSPEPTSIEFIALAKDEDYLGLIAEDVSFYPHGQENVVSDVPDLSAFTPMIDYNGVKFYITRVNTREEEGSTNLMKGFVVNDSDMAYHFDCWGDEIEANGQPAYGNYFGFYLYPHTVHYFQGWLDTDEVIHDGDAVEIGMMYEISECYVDKGEVWISQDNSDPVVSGTMFKCTAPAFKIE